MLYWFYIAAIGLAVALPFILIGYVWPRRGLPGAIPLLGLLAATVCWAIGYLIEYTASTLAIKLFAWNISYIGITTIPVILFVFSLKFTQGGHWLKPPVFALLLLVPAITLLLQWTKEFHSLMYYDFRLVTDGLFLLVAKKYGAWFWVFVIYNYAILLASVSVLIYRVFSPSRLFIDQAILLLTAIIVPFLANAEYLLHFLPGPHVDWTPAAFVVSAVALVMAISRHNFLDVVPVARDNAIELMDEGFMVLDEEHRILDFNHKMEKIMGAAGSSLKRKPLDEIILTQLKTNYEFASGGSADMEIKLEREGEPRIYGVHFTPILRGQGKKSGHVVVFHDITEHKHNEEAIERIAFYDQLTGLANRVLLADRAEMALSAAARHKRMLAIMVIDVDRFKEVNDNLGHAAGDMVLKEIALRLTEAVRKVDTVSRLGGDEFIILLPEISHEETLNSVAQRIMESTHRPYHIAEQEINLTISMGVSTYPKDGDTLDQLVRNADMAMYHVKQHGRNNWRRYVAGMPGLGSRSPVDGKATGAA